MTSENFCYWLQGWFELNNTVNGPVQITEHSLKMIADHLQLVFKKDYGYQMLDTRFTGVSSRPLC